MERKQNRTDFEEPNIEITNVLAIGSFGHQIDIRQLARHLRKEDDLVVPNHPPTILYINLLKPPAKICIHQTGTIKCIKSKSENEAKLAIKKISKIMEKLNFILPALQTPKVQIINVNCFADLKKKVGCGIIPKARPNAKLALSLKPETFLEPIGTAKIRIFPNGKIIGTGFKSEEETREKITEVAKSIFSAIEKYDDAREESCQTERVNPTLGILRDYIQGEKGKEILEGFDEKTLQEILIKTELIIREFCEKRIRDSLGFELKTIAAGALYQAQLKLNIKPKMTLKEIADIFETVEPSVGKASRAIEKTLLESEKKLTIPRRAFKKSPFLLQ